MVLKGEEDGCGGARVRKGLLQNLKRVHLGVGMCEARTCTPHTVQAHTHTPTGRHREGEDKGKIKRWGRPVLRGVKRART